MEIKGNNLLKISAKHFYNLNFNICTISNEKNEHNFLERKILKAPSNSYKNLFNRRQSNEEFNDLDLNSSVGIGIILGFNNIMVIDVDGCIDIDLVNFILEELELPKDYNWVIKSGSKSGFHIILKCINRNLDNKKFGCNSVDSFYPNPLKYFDSFYHNNYNISKIQKYFNENYTIKNLFQKIEFGWEGFLVIPPSIHSSGSNYEFIHEIPITEPLDIDFGKLDNLRKFIASEEISISTIENNYQASLIYHSKDYESNHEIKYIFFSIVSNENPKDNSMDYTNLDSSTNILQITWLVVNKNFSLLRVEDFLINNTNVQLDFNALNIYNLTLEKLNLLGLPIKFALNKFLEDIGNCDGPIISYNLDFNLNIIKSEFIRNGLNIRLLDKKHFECFNNSYKKKFSYELSHVNKLIPLEEIYFNLFKKELITSQNSIFNTFLCKICYEKIYKEYYL